MKIALAADHAGFALKELLRDHLRDRGYEVDDFGAFSEDSTDYPDYAAEVARRVTRGQADRGVLVCSTGVGMSIAANKINGARAAVGSSEEEVRLTREHNDANVLCLGAKFTPFQEAARFIQVFMDTPFSAGSRHVRRIQKISELEHCAQDAPFCKS
jgi:ribose 5-phosphate isomerase B